MMLFKGMLVLLVVTPIVLEMQAFGAKIQMLAIGEPTTGTESNGKITHGSAALKEHGKLGEGLQQGKREMCSYLLNILDTKQDDSLDLEKVTHMFEASLEHVAKTASYVTLMEPYISNDLVSEFDKHTGDYVLKLSDARRKLIELYQQAEKDGSSDEAKRNILETYFYKACESKLSTIVTEKSMLDSALKAEQALSVKLLNTIDDDGGDNDKQ